MSTTLAAFALALPLLAAPAAASAPARTGAGVVLTAPAPPSIEQRASLQRQVRAALATSTASSMSIRIEASGAGAVYAHSSTTQLLPASNEKLLTGLAALATTAPGARYDTQLWRTGRESLPPVPLPLQRLRSQPLPLSTRGVVHGDLVLVASGDPTLTSAHLTAMARSVRDAGIVEVRGDLYVDDTRYDRVRRASGWKPSYVPDELGPLSAFALDRNSARRDSSYLADPALGNLERLRVILSEAGVMVRGESRVGRPAAALTQQIAAHHSGPMSVIVASMMRRSDNFHAEMLLKEIGARRGAGSTAGGARVIAELAQSWGVPLGYISDGSGLSQGNRQSAVGLVEWLQAARTQSSFTQFRDGLPVACVSGTLARRMCGTPAAGNVRAKTGTLNGVIALSGYATTRSGRQVEFSMLCSGVRSHAAARASLDKAAIAIAGWSG